MVTARKKNTTIASPEDGIIISVNGLSIARKCSKFSYIRKAQNKENAIIAYCSFFKPFFRYAEIERAINTPDNTEPIIYNTISITSLISI
ncbi:MAG: hypothetical protein M3O68_09180 [Thermoproteota archaeon]|nr:hypothetical protein [Thermoproteota archaeon]